MNIDKVTVCSTPYLNLSKAVGLETTTQALLFENLFQWLKKIMLQAKG
jgi:hypothetical protein